MNARPTHLEEPSRKLTIASSPSLCIGLIPCIPLPICHPAIRMPAPWPLFPPSERSLRHESDSRSLHSALDNTACAHPVTRSFCNATASSHNSTRASALAIIEFWRDGWWLCAAGHRRGGGGGSRCRHFVARWGGLMLR